jgi:hypothetical protein
MTAPLSKIIPSIIAMTLAILISPADAGKKTGPKTPKVAKTTAAKGRTSSSPECSYVVESWQEMGKTTSVPATNATACCYYLGSTTQTSGIPGVNCTSTGIVIEIQWGALSLQGSIPAELGYLRNLELM